MTWRKLGFDWLGSHLSGGERPDPTKFSRQQGSSVPTNTGPQYPTGTPGGSPSSPSGSAFTSDQRTQLQNAFSVGGVWETIVGLGGDVWERVKGLLPKDANGNIDWGAIGSDVVKWVKDNKSTIIDGLNAYNQYQRSQKSDEYAKKAVEGMQKSYDAKEPLRVAGQAGMLNPQANTPDLSGLNAQGQRGLGIQAPMPVAAPNANLRAAQGIAGSGSGNPFAAPTAALPVAGGPTQPGGPTGPNQPGMPPIQRPVPPTAPRPLPVGTGPTVNPTPALPTSGTVAFPGATQQPLPVSFAPQSGPIKNGPQDHTMPNFTPAPASPSALPVAPHYLQGGVESGADGQPIQGGYNALTDTYRQLGATPGSVNPRILALVKQNPALIDSLPPDQRDTLKRTMAGMGV